MIQDFSQTMAGWGIPDWAPVAVMILVGILLWGAGRRFLKFGLALAAFTMGAALGHAVGDSVSIGVPPWISGVILGFLFAIVAALTYRLVILVLLTGVCAIVAPLAVTSVANLRPDGGTSLVIDEDLMKHHEETLERAAKAIDAFREQWAAKIGLNERGEARLNSLGGWGAQTKSSIQGFWEQTPEKLRPTLVLASVAGGVAGLFMGILAPSFGALLLTAFGGSLLWITGARIAATHFGVGEGPWLPSPSTHSVAFASMWLITSLVGMSAQWFFRGKTPQNADKPA